MACIQFPEITFQDGSWFLNEMPLPNSPMMNNIWSAASYVLCAEVDDCGANLQKSIECLRIASKAFAGISELLADKANRLEE